MTLKKQKSNFEFENEKENFEKHFRERELEQELANATAKLALTSKELEISKKQESLLKVQRIELPARTEIIYEKVK